MKVSVRFYAYLGDLIQNKNDIEIQLEEGSNIRDLLEKIFKSYDIRNKIMEDTHTVKQWVKILINGRQLRFLSGLQTILKPNDKISIFPPVIGG